jgi:hypothetical protein
MMWPELFLHKFQQLRQELAVFHSVNSAGTTWSGSGWYRVGIHAA